MGECGHSVRWQSFGYQPVAVIEVQSTRKQSIGELKGTGLVYGEGGGEYRAEARCGQENLKSGSHGGE